MSSNHVVGADNRPEKTAQPISGSHQVEQKKADDAERRLPDSGRGGYRDLWRLIRSAQPSLPLLLLAVVCTAMSVAALLWFPVLTRDIVDGIGRGGEGRVPMWFLAVLLLGASLSAALSGYLMSAAGYGVIAKLRKRLIDKIMRLPVTAFDLESSGERVSRVLRDCESITELTTRQAVNLVAGIFMLIGSVVVLLLLDERLTLTLFGAMLGAFAVMIPISFVLHGLSKQMQDRTARLSAILTHVFSEIRLVKAFTAEGREFARSGVEIDGLYRLGRKTAGVHAVLEPIVNLAMTTAVLLILLSGASRVARGELSIGTLTAFILYVLNVIAPMVQLTQFIAELQKAKGASQRVTAMLKEKEEPRVELGLSMPRGEVLEFADVHMAYPGRTPVLKGLSLRIEPGKTTALVGASGGGKTTILSLIERFYSPTSGAVSYAGRSVEEYALGEWRRGIGYVAQNSPVMPGTVRENLLYGLSAEYSDEELHRAAAAAGALDFIEALPQGFDTILIEQGNNLSGGQRQRIAIARMFLRDPTILILDEATSNLDSGTEAQIRGALAELMRGRTNIVVAHRLSSVMDADRIYILEDGRITGGGHHEELYVNHPGYARLVQQQMRPADTEPKRSAVAEEMAG